MNNKLLEILNNQDGRKELEGLLGDYQRIFGLKYTHYRERVSQDFFTYCQKGSFFIEVIAYNSQREIFVQRDLTRNKNAWELIGGWINQGESFENALDRVVAKETGSLLVEAIPIGIIKNTYFTNDNVTSHTGILYIGRIKDDEPMLKNGMFTKSPEKYLSGKDKKIAILGQKILANKILAPPINEVISYSKNQIRRFFHKTIIKTLSYIGSSRIIQKRTIDQIKSSDKSVLDVACGDDLTILKIQREGRAIVANDISRDSLKKISLKDKNKDVIFSNQNMLDMRFNKKFDAVIVKNVLHHLGNPEEIDYFLNNLKSVGKKFIIIDIIDPKLNILARMWNKYYILFLDDQGDYFIDYEQFKKILKLYFSDSKIEFSKIWTIKGPYMMAVVEN
jgi:ubiquinone/menaquinone biosynthesis C-methylase UbiE/ADP-ribose pyrophosphatase YjhB (NUDIX family)